MVCQKCIQFFRSESWFIEREIRKNRKSLEENAKQKELNKKFWFERNREESHAIRLFHQEVVFK
jgi:hypothetical protein